MFSTFLLSQNAFDLAHHILSPPDFILKGREGVSDILEIEVWRSTLATGLVNALGILKSLHFLASF